MIRLIRDLVRPYRGTLLIILLAMMVETAMSLAAPWPLKVIIDNVVGTHKLPHWLDQMVRPMLEGGARLQVAGLAALAVVIIALLGALAAYVDNYFTESVGMGGQRSPPAHLPSFAAPFTRLLRHPSNWYSSQHHHHRHPDDPGFCSRSSTLNIFVDLLTIVSMLGLMFWLNWDFTMIAVGVTPFLLFFVSRFKKAVKKATHEVRKEQSQIVAVVQQGLESMQVVKAFGRQDLEEANLAEVSHATVNAALAARRVKSMLSPVVTVTVALCTAVVLWRGAALILAGAMTVGALTVYLSYLSKFFKPVKIWPPPPTP